MKYICKEGVPESFLMAMSNDKYDVKRNDQSIISVSALINPPIVRQLTIRHWDDLVTDIDDMEASWKGTAMHNSMEDSIDNVYWIQEKRPEIDVDGVTLSGKADVYRLDTCQIVDYKFPKISNFLMDPGHKKWEEQTNCYAYLYRKYGFSVNSIEVHAMLQEWNKHYASKEGYPPNSKLAVNIPLWSEEEQRAFIEERISIHKKFIDTPDNELVTCTPEERFRSQTIHKLYKNDNKRCTATEKYEENLEDVLNEYQVKYPKATFQWKTFEGEDKKCKLCNVNNFCSYYTSLNHV